MLNGRKHVNNPNMSSAVIVSSVWGWKWDILANLNNVKMRLTISEVCKLTNLICKKMLGNLGSRVLYPYQAYL